MGKVPSVPTAGPSMDFLSRGGGALHSQVLPCLMDYGGLKSGGLPESRGSMYWLSSRAGTSAMSHYYNIDLHLSFINQLNPTLYVIAIVLAAVD